MLDNKIGNSISVLKTIQDNEIWSGSAASTFNEDVSSLIGKLDTVKGDLATFDSALSLLNDLKSLDANIESLKSSLWTIPADADEATKSSYESHNSSINNSIALKTEERRQLKEKIVGILASFGVIAELSVLNIPNIEGANVLYTYDTGCIYELYTASGQKYEAFIPYQVDPSAPVIVYDPGDSSSEYEVNSSYNWQTFKTFFKTEGYEYIVIRSLRSDNSLYYNDLCDKLELNPSNRLFISHSGGTTYNFYEYCDLVKEDDSVPGVIAVMDGYTPASWFESQGVTQTIKDSGTIVFGFHQNWKNGYADNYQAFAKSGINMLILSDQSELGHSHGGVNLTLTQNGVAAFLTGDGPLPDNYVITYYNQETGSFEEIPHSEVSTLDDVYDFFGIDK